MNEIEELRAKVKSVEALVEEHHGHSPDPSIRWQPDVCWMCRLRALLGSMG